MHGKLILALMMSLPVILTAECGADSMSRALGGGEYGWTGWSSTGSGWKSTDCKRLGDPYPDRDHYESSEEGVGAFRSPEFIVQGGLLRFWACGWNRIDGTSSSTFRLCRSKDGAPLRIAAPPQQNDFSMFEWHTRDIIGQRVYFEADDECSAPGYAWLGLAGVIEMEAGATDENRRYTVLPFINSSFGAWGILSHDAVRRPTEPYLSSLADNGEMGVGAIETPVFTVDSPQITIMARGWDAIDGSARRNRIDLVDAESGRVLHSCPPPLSDMPKQIVIDTSDCTGRRMYLRFVDGNNGTSFAWMGIDSINAGNAFNVRLDQISALDGWKSSSTPASLTEQFGVPFMTNGRSILNSELHLGFEAKRLLLLGMNVPDDVWYWVGDDFGSLCVRYRDGITDHYPLIVGESLWWGKRFHKYPDPFTSFAKARKAFADSIKLYPQKPVHDGMYLAAIDTQKGKAIDSVFIEPNPKLGAQPRIFGVTAELPDGESPNGATITKGGIISRSLGRFYREHPLRTAGVDEQKSQTRVDAIRNIMYCTNENFPPDFAVSKPVSYRGPSIRFEGDSIAHLVTNIFNYNADDMTSKVTSDGVYHTSTKGAAWYGYDGFGCFTLDESKATRNHAGFYYDEAWTRDLGRTLCELIALGYTDKAKECADWCFKMARVWEESNSPDLLINGKRLPPHIHRILQMPGTAVGMGCFENDGHGLTTMFIYNLWRKLPDRDNWLRSRWRDVKALGDWVVWQLENKDISRATDVLWSDSEGSGWNITTGYSIYCDLAEIEALRGLIIMAESIGQTDIASKWRITADSLKTAADREYVEYDPKYGDTWTKRFAGFGLSSTLGPIILPTDFHGFDTDRNYPEWRQYNEAAYSRIKDTFHLNAMGYGEGFIIQSALLLDKMRDAEDLLKLTARAIYNPTHRPYIVPENVAANSDNTVISRLGDLGNGVQQAEIIKAIRIMAGIDDTNPSLLRIMPRLLKCWNKMDVERMPALIESDGKLLNSSVSYSMEMKPDSAAMMITSKDRLPEISLRLGPFTVAGQTGASAKPIVKVNETAADGNLIKSGDSYWVWLSIPGGLTHCKIQVSLPNASLDQ